MFPLEFAAEAVENTGLLLDTYSEEDVEEKAALVYRHLLARYQDADNNVYKH